MARVDSISSKDNFLSDVIALHLIFKLMLIKTSTVITADSINSS